MANSTLYGSVIVTYRCNAKCNMCDCFKDPTRPEEELTLETIRKLPDNMDFCNITGGEPFIRRDLGDIIGEIYKKTKRIVVSTNGYFYDRIIETCEKYPELGIRISIEGMPKTNDEIRGIPNGFDRALRCLLHLKAIGHPDVGFGMTVQDMNCEDLVSLYHLSEHMDMEFATASLHNSFYFRKTDNAIQDKYKVAKAFEELINELLKSNSPKKWFRAYFNHGLINYIYGNPRYLPCDMGRNGFFLDPYGDVLPCNGMTQKMPMGNLNEKTFDEIWHSEQAEKVRAAVKSCPKNCWMIGSVSPMMHQKIQIPAKWALEHKFLKRGYSLEENDFIKVDA